MGHTRTKHLIVWVTEDQHAMVRAAAKDRGETMATFLRKIINLGWKAQQQAAAVEPPKVRASMATSEKEQAALAWLPASGEWSSTACPWQIVGAMMSLRRRGLVESKKVRDYPVQLRWRIATSNDGGAR